MRVLYLGLNGDDVRQWQNYLVGQGFFHSEVSGTFDPDTKQATIDFQRAYNLNADGVVGNMTFGCAMQNGFPAADDSSANPDENSPNWPSPPDFSPLVSMQQRQSVFGVFTYVAAPTPSNPEAIQITNDWAQKNIVQVEIPQLSSVQGASSGGSVAFHQLAATQLQNLWKEWEDAGLLNLVLTWAGSYAPRFVRGSTTYLSNHAFGTAFDINAAWNPLGAVPALTSQKGSTRKLVEIANKWGFFWGGHFQPRRDGMHFEVAKIVTP